MLRTFVSLLILVLMWITTGIAQNPEWINYTKGYRTHAIAADSLCVWAGTQGGLVRIDRTTGETTFYNKANSGLPSNEIHSLAIDDNGILWMTSGSSLVSFDDTNWTIYDAINLGLQYGLESIAIDNNGTKWFGTWGDGLVSFDGTNWAVLNSINSGLPDDDVHWVTIENNGTKWIGTSGGLASFDGTNWTIYDESNSGLPESYTIHKYEPTPIEPDSDFIKHHREFEARPENEVSVKSTLRNSHPLVQASKVILSNPHIDRYKRCSGGRGCLDISVGKNSVHRALLIMDALIKALSKRGYETYLSGEYKWVTSVNVEGEEFNIRIMEPSKEIPVADLDEEDKPYSYGRFYDYVPTGNLTLQITNFYHGDKSVRDTKTQRIEDKLNSFIFMLIKASEYEKNWRIEREIERKENEVRRQRAQEIRHQREQEQQMIKELFDNAATWNKCVLVRNYILAVQNHADEASDGEELNSWVLWANQQVDMVESRMRHPF